ncbi:MAG TPA: pentapeptide repeat-containing protein [Candidatus Nitrosocosmicus sp.]
MIYNASKIFEENKIIYSDLDNKPKVEFWKEKDVSSYEKAYENYMYKGISLIVIKHLAEERNPEFLYHFISDSHNIIPNLRYFPFVRILNSNLSDTNLSLYYLSYDYLLRSDLSGAHLSNANLSGANLLNLCNTRDFQIDSDTDFYYALIDNEDFLNSFINIIR